MPTKRLLILANSVKKKQHCIAGREIVDAKAKDPYGAWIRPVSRDGEGELTASNCCFDDMTLPKVFDVVDVPLEVCENSLAQPENWFIDSARSWVKVGDQRTLKLPAVYAEGPDDLWIEPNRKQDRISPEGLAALKRSHSLYLVAVTDFRIEIDWHSLYEYHRRRATFKYNNSSYNFSLTDPEMDKHWMPYPARGESKTVELPTGGDKILCVSLTPPFQGDHYKIVATVLEIAK